MASRHLDTELVFLDLIAYLSKSDTQTWKFAIAKRQVCQFCFIFHEIYLDAVTLCFSYGKLNPRKPKWHSDI